MKTWTCLLVSLCWLSVTRAQIAYWDFEFSPKSGGDFILPIAANYMDPQLAAAELDLNQPVNNNGTPNACLGNESWGTNFWTLAPQTDGERIECRITTQPGIGLQVSGLTLYLSRTTDAVQFFHLTYDMGNGETPLVQQQPILYTDSVCGSLQIPLSLQVPAGGFLYLYLYPFQALNGAATLRLDEVTLEGSSAPVQWLDFTAQPIPEGIHLQWRTAAEWHNDYFEVERSVDGQTFLPIGRLNSQGNSQSVTSYSFVDADPPPGTLYYRLRQVDQDGRHSYSKTLSTSSPNPSHPEVQVYTHNGRLWVYSPHLAPQIHLYDATGRLCQQWGPVEGGTLQSFPLPHLPAGAYIVQVGKSSKVIGLPYP